MYLTVVLNPMNILQLLLLSHHDEEVEEDGLRLFRHRLNAIGRSRRQRRITRRALQHPSMSAFAILFGSGCDQSLLTLCGFDHMAFRELLASFTAIYYQYTPYSSDGHIRRLVTGSNGGRPRSLSDSHCLALTLAWMRSKGSESFLSLIFGVTGSVCAIFIRFGRRILIRTLKRDPRSAIRMPSIDEIRRFQEAFAYRHSALTDVYCVADGLKLFYSSKVETQSYKIVSLTDGLMITTSRTY